MLPDKVKSAILTLLDPIRSGIADSVRARWRAGGRDPGVATEISQELRNKADELGDAFAPLTEMESLGNLFKEPGGEVLFAWCSASTWRRDAQMARLLAAAASEPAFADRVAAVAR